MELRMKNFNIMVRKNQYTWGGGGLGQFSDLRGGGGLAKEEGVFLRGEGGLIPQCIL